MFEVSTCESARFKNESPHSLTQVLLTKLVSAADSFSGCKRNLCWTGVLSKKSFICWLNFLQVQLTVWRDLQSVLSIKSKSGCVIYVLELRFQTFVKEVSQMQLDSSRTAKSTLQHLKITTKSGPELMAKCNSSRCLPEKYSMAWKTHLDLGVGSYLVGHREGYMESCSFCSSCDEFSSSTAEWLRNELNFNSD